jgi:hypothetical protein
VRSYWVEARLKAGRKPTEVYEYMESWLGLHHHFWDEPWWPDAYVVRVHGPLKDLAKCDAVDHLVVWDEEPDGTLYGESWIRVARFFEAAADLGEVSTAERHKLVHCFLNSQGMSWTDELRFFFRGIKGRISMAIRWNLYLRRKWEKEVGAPVKETVK